MMKDFCYRYVVAMALVAVSLSSCTKTSVSGDEEEGMVVRFGKTDVVSRAAITNEGFLAEGNSFQVWGAYRSTTDASFTPTLVFNGTNVTREGEAWTYTDMRYWLPGFRYNFRALYPVDLEGVTFDENAVLLSIAEYDGRGQDDILYAAPGEIKAVQGMMPAVALDFRHVLSRVVFVGAVLPALGKEVTVTSVKVYGMAVKGKWTGTAEAPCGTWTASGERATDVLPYASNNSGVRFPTTGESRVVLEVLMIPQSIPADAVVEITYNYGDGVNRTQRANLNAVSVSFGATWKPGAGYRYSFTVGDADYILFERPAVTEWIDADGGNYIIQ